MFVCVPDQICVFVGIYVRNPSFVFLCVVVCVCVCVRACVSVCVWLRAWLCMTEAVDCACQVLSQPQRQSVIACDTTSPVWAHLRTCAQSSSLSLSLSHTFNETVIHTLIKCLLCA